MISMILRIQSSGFDNYKLNMDVGQWYSDCNLFMMLGNVGFINSSYIAMNHRIKPIERVFVLSSTF